MKFETDRRNFLVGGVNVFAFLVFSGGQMFDAAQAQVPGPSPEIALNPLLSGFENAHFIEARNAAVIPEMVAQGRPVIIFGQRVVLDGLYVTKGFPLGIIARELTCASGAVVDTSGLRGEPHFLSGNRATDGQKRGESGKEGAAGGVGAASAPIFMLCDSLVGSLNLRGVGGDGGDGQAGGNGMEGAGGAGGRNEPKCDNGGKGGTGGNAGAGGPGGDGGAGGQLLIQVRKSVGADQIVGQVFGGKGGSAGAHGTAGEGGPGGPGTPSWRRTRDPNEGGSPMRKD